MVAKPKNLRFWSILAIFGPFSLEEEKEEEEEEEEEEREQHLLPSSTQQGRRAQGLSV